jgi:hypothetical protein
VRQNRKGTAGRDGGQDTHGAGQSSYQVTSARPAGATPWPQDQADRSLPRHTGQSSRGSDPIPGPEHRPIMSVVPMLLFSPRFQRHRRADVACLAAISGRRCRGQGGASSIVGPTLRLRGGARNLRVRVPRRTGRMNVVRRRRAGRTRILITCRCADPALRVDGAEIGPVRARPSGSPGTSLNQRRPENCCRPTLLLPRGMRERRSNRGRRS